MPTLRMTPTWRRALPTLLNVAVLAVALSCDSDSTQPGEPSLRIVPDSFDLVVGESVVLTAFRVESGGAMSEVLDADWQSLDDGIATVDATGRVQAISEGSTRVVAVSEDLVATARVVVLDPVVSLVVEPESTTVAVADTVLLQARAVRASGSSFFPTGVTWTSLSPTLASVGASTGQVAGANPGTARIEARFETLAAEATVVVARWRRLASLPAPRRTGHLAALAGKLYYIGGDASLSEDYVSTTFVFDPVAGTWSTAASMPTARGQGAVAVLDGRVHVIGGANPNAPDNVANRLRVHEVYDPGTETWEALAPISAHRGGLRADTLEGLIYVVGGTRGDEPFDSVEAYDATADSWAAAPSLPSPRITFGIGSIGGRLHVAGGEGPSRSTLADIVSFDPGTNDWSSGAAIPGGRHRVASAVQGGRLIVLGGLAAVDGGPPLSDALAYDPATDVWLTLPSLPLPLVDAAAAVLNGELYVVGGITVGGSVTTRAFVAIP